MKLFAILLSLALAGCGQKIVYKTVPVPVFKACIDEAPISPDYQFGKTEYRSDKEAAATLIKDYELAKQYGVDWEAAAAGCMAVSE